MENVKIQYMGYQKKVKEKRGEREEERPLHP
jgi:hypothetical protein